MTSPFVNNPQYWRDRAIEMRALAGECNDAEKKAIMLRLANDFDKLAERTEKTSDVLNQSRHIPAG